MRTQTRILLFALIAALFSSIVVAQEETATGAELPPPALSSIAEEPVTGVEPTPSVESSIAENEEVIDPSQQTEPKPETKATVPPSEDPVSFQGSQRLQTDGIAGSASSNSDSSNSENSEGFNVESMPGGPVIDLPTESMESKENQDPESEESFTLPAGQLK